MKIPFVDLQRQYQQYKTEIDQAIHEVLDQSNYIGGAKIKSFEEQFARQCGTKHCIGVANGTDAIYITLKMLGIGEGDEVITSACSWIATSETISQTGAKPIFVDIGQDYLIDVEQIESKINSNTKAIVPVHLYGQMADMDAIKKIADKHDLIVVEDSAQAHLADRGGWSVGASSHAATFSFYPGKNLGAYGDAGGIVTNDDQLAEKCRQFANHGQLVKHQHKIEGINSRLDTIQAAVLSVKLQYLSDWTSRRINIAKQYNEALKGVSGLRLPIVNSNSNPVYHLYVVSAENREGLQNYLKSNEISTAIHYPTPLPFLDCYQDLNHKVEDFPVAHAESSKILSLPIFPEMTTKEVDYVCEHIRHFYDSH
ncbi:MAG: DegT/DnrJ/EryC1/StrS family aminotransferase [Reichenbachiella sp.]|uniref:DegT/DnrJ/EryC1/StrS family aminotransferase n=1 Tax=Reichenbachiella sp. TaxID=2184521 RepID=UPI002967273E|nr:DegT/DnrJ/EryC1/StrS family aminotransferase [Reichenbachiella sp.]MDW3211686.1 DegT/DnrJ/EryC1/StrS family aminotransferase [Reichenbachiella sp.]